MNVLCDEQHFLNFPLTTSDKIALDHHPCNFVCCCQWKINSPSAHNYYNLKLLRTHHLICANQLNLVISFHHCALLIDVKFIMNRHGIWWRICPISKSIIKKHNVFDVSLPMVKWLILTWIWLWTFGKLVFIFILYLFLFFAWLNAIIIIFMEKMLHTQLVNAIFMCENVNCN